MTALAVAKEVQEQEGKLMSLPCAVDIFYKGALIKINAAGFAEPCASEAGSEFVGICYADVDNSGGAAGDLEVRVITTGVFALTIAGATQADVGSKVYATDDQLVTVTSAASKQIVGNIIKYVSATSVLVRLAPFSGVGV